MKKSPSNPTKPQFRPTGRTVSGPKAPSGLSKEAKTWWKRVVSEWDLDDSGLLLLEGALECFDRMRQAQDLIATEGLVLTDRFNQKKPHPAAKIETDAKATLCRYLKALNLDIEPLNSGPGRPSGGSHAD